jgi:hypothetical protein
MAADEPIPTLQEQLETLALKEAVERGMDHRNLGAAAIGYVARTLRFLEFCVDDYGATTSAYMEHLERERQMLEHYGAGTHTLTPEENEVVFEGYRLNALVQYRIESFYFFAQRLLDEVATMIDAFFRPSQTTLGRHRTLATNLPALVAEHGVAPPIELLSLANEVTERIKRFRDENVAHVLKLDHVRKSRGVVWNAQGQPRIAIGWIYAQPGEELGTQSEVLLDLLALVERYVASAAAFLVEFRRDTR